MSLPPTVSAELERAFHGAEVDRARTLLPSEEKLGNDYERVLLAIVALAKGSLSSLAHYSQQARNDWRDVLYWHEHPDEVAAPKSYGELRQRLGLPPDHEAHASYEHLRRLALDGSADESARCAGIDEVGQIADSRSCRGAP